MRGLTPFRSRRGEPSVGERGAVAVLVALLMVPMLTVAALVIDVADLWAQRQRLQIGADATALAVATDCQRGSCGNLITTARTFTRANIGGSGIPTGVVSVSGGTVHVTANMTVDHLFAPVIGINSTTLSLAATATYSAPISGTSVLPLTVNACEYNLATGGRLPTGATVRTLSWAAVSSGCYNASGVATSKLGSGYVQPGGFSWLKTSSGCRAATSISSESQTSGSSSVPSTSCTATSFAALQNTTVLLPLFDSYRQPSSSNTSNVYYSIYGYVPFRITGYYFGTGLAYNSSCSGTARCLHGYFTRLTEPDSAFSYDDSGPQVGAGVVTLTE